MKLRNKYPNILNRLLNRHSRHLLMHPRHLLRHPRHLYLRPPHKQSNWLLDPVLEKRSVKVKQDQKREELRKKAKAEAKDHFAENIEKKK
jgi:hypothetical protein